MWFAVLFLLAELEPGLKVGTCGAKFLAIPIGARAAGLSGAYVALGAEAMSCFWNPALVGRTPRGISFECSYTNYMLGMKHGGFAFVRNLGMAKYTYSIFAGGLNSGDMEVTTVDNPWGTGEKFYYYGYVIGAGFAKWLTDRFVFGVNLKVISEGLSYKVGSWWRPSIDFGVFYKTEFKGLNLGACVRNFGPDMRPPGKFVVIEEGDTVKEGGEAVERRFRSYPVFMDFRFGLSLDLKKGDGYNVVGAVEIVHPNDNKERLIVGLEANFQDKFYLRAGRPMILKGFGSVDDKSIGSIGLGIRFSNMNFDYSYTDRGLLPDVQRVTFGVKF